MVSKEFVHNLVSDLKKSAKKAYENNEYNDALSLISISAAVLYKTNIYYRDDDLENMLNDISKELSLHQSNYASNETVCLFWDGFGLNDRGLAQIYLKALCKVKKVIYVTYEDRRNEITDIKSILEENRSVFRFIHRKQSSYLKQISQLQEIIQEYKPASLFFYSEPDDVVATPIMYSYEGLLKRVQINLTDHAFWLGAGCVDTCIEFREYGACVSNHYRNIGNEAIRIISFYPMIHEEREFQGYPFDVKPGQKVVFSGGALYKTFGEDNRYYKIVDRLLAEHEKVIFWYAGSGDDSEMKKILRKYPGRAYLTAERSDLFQVLKHCTFYLSTYPICGGLMYQYAAKAGRVPVTLKCDECTEGFLINQENLNVEFNDENKMFEEIDKLLNDSTYLLSREKNMTEAVITPESFDDKVADIFHNCVSSNLYPMIDTTLFRQRYLNTLTEMDVERTTLKKNSIGVGMKYYPGRFLRGGIYILQKTLLKFP